MTIRIRLMDTPMRKRRLRKLPVLWRHELFPQIDLPKLRADAAARMAERDARDEHDDRSDIQKWLGEPPPWLRAFLQTPPPAPMPTPEDEEAAKIIGRYLAEAVTAACRED